MKRIDANTDHQSGPGPLTPVPTFAAARARSSTEAGFGLPRTFLGNRFVYALISQRGRGLSIGVNMNPDKVCNFDCPYCEVNRDLPSADRTVDVAVLTVELENLLALAFQGKLRELPYFSTVPQELLVLKEVALSGDGEPTFSPNFEPILREVVHLRSHRRFPFFKIVLITNASGLDRPEVQRGLGYLSSADEIWAKLDAGSPAYMDKVNRPQRIPLRQILSNIVLVARQRPVIIQSLFPLINGCEPATADIEDYAQKLRNLKESGANISLVQVYSAHRAPHRPDCGHVSLKCLSRIAQRVREVSGLPAEVF